jgi:hypothetical protein
MNYDELRTSFVGLLKRRDITTTDRDAYLQSALARCQSELRVPAMEQDFTVTMTADMDGKIAVPGDYLKMKALICDDLIKQRDLTQVLRLRANGVGTPVAYTRRAGYWWLAPVPLVGTVIDGEYYKELPALSAGTDTNWLSEIKPFAILYAALSEAAPFYVDRRGESWEQKFVQAIGELQSQADEDELVNASVEPSIIYPSDC